MSLITLVPIMLLTFLIFFVILASFAAALLVTVLRTLMRHRFTLPHADTDDRGGPVVDASWSVLHPHAPHDQSAHAPHSIVQHR